MTHMKSRFEDFIENLYIKISITSPEQLNIELIARGLDIEVEYSHKKSKFAEIDSIMMIRLNENLSKAEQWQELAHEVCHLLKHSGNQTVLLSLLCSCKSGKLKHLPFTSACLLLCLKNWICLSINGRPSIKLQSYLIWSILL